MGIDMRFASFTIAGLDSWGPVQDGQVTMLHERWPTLSDAIAADALTVAWDAEGPRASLADISWQPLLPAPGKIFCVGLNYEEHRRETGRDVVAHPTIFTRFAESQAAHDAPILLPPESTKLDYEGELAVVIGRGGRRISADAALDHVAGYSCYNDGSLRDWQSHTTQFTPGKNFYRTGGFGPWLVTPDEFGPLGPQRIMTRLNGEVMQSSTLDHMIFPVARLIEYLSTIVPLNPGDVIVSGTPGGVGAKRQPPVFMKSGDRVEVEIDGIGTLVNTVEAETLAA